MTRAEAQLIYDVTDGYVALARTLTKEVPTRFPLPQAYYEKLFSSLREGMHRCADSDAVFVGTKVAIEPARLDRLVAAQKRLDEIEMKKNIGAET